MNAQRSHLSYATSTFIRIHLKVVVVDFVSSGQLFENTLSREYITNTGFCVVVWTEKT